MENEIVKLYFTSTNNYYITNHHQDVLHSNVLLPVQMKLLAYCSHRELVNMAKEYNEKNPSTSIEDAFTLLEKKFTEELGFGDEFVLIPSRDEEDHAFIGGPEEGTLTLVEKIPLPLWKKQYGKYNDIVTKVNKTHIEIRSKHFPAITQIEKQINFYVRMHAETKRHYQDLIEDMHKEIASVEMPHLLKIIRDEYQNNRDENQ